MNDRPAPTVGHSMSFDWTATYPSRRQPIFARNAVATSQPLATQAGIAMLRAGGNAIDAALATAIALTVVEPCSNGLGSDLFAIVWDGRGLAGLNASGRAPAAWTPERFARYREMPRTGWDTVTIPGAVSGWVALSQRYGKLPFADLFASAIGYARNGYAVSPIIADKWAKAVPILGNVPGFAEHFLPRGRAPEPGELFASPALAAAERLLTRRSGAGVVLADPEDLGGSGRSVVARARLARNPFSLITRGPRAGRLLRLAGLAAVSASGLLGGHISFRLAGGANHAEEIPHLVKPGWQHLMAAADLPEGKVVRQMLGEVPVAAVRLSGAVHVLADRCSHMSGPLSDGELADGCLTCPWHGSMFRLTDGSVAQGPATAPQPAFEVREVGGAIQVCLPGAG